MIDYEETKEDAILSLEQQIKQLVKDAFDKGYQCGYHDYKAEQTEPRRKTTDYCDICNHEGCENCIANSLDDYCVPSNFERKESE